MINYLGNHGFWKVLGHALHHVLAERRCARADEPERAEVVFPDTPELGERYHDRRHAEEVSDTVPLHGGHHRVHVKP